MLGIYLHLIFLKFCELFITGDDIQSRRSWTKKSENLVSKNRIKVRNRILIIYIFEIRIILVERFILSKLSIFLFIMSCASCETIHDIVKLAGENLFLRFFLSKTSLNRRILEKGLLSHVLFNFIAWPTDVLSI